MKLLKPDLVRATAAHCGYSQAVCAEVLDAMHDAVLDHIAIDRDVMLAGLGKLEIRRRPKRDARNPRTGESVVTPARQYVVLRPSVSLREAANG